MTTATEPLDGTWEANAKEAWAAFAMIREAVEALAPVGAVPRGEDFTPSPMDEAEALVAGIMAIAHDTGLPKAIALARSMNEHRTPLPERRLGQRDIHDMTRAWRAGFNTCLAVMELVERQEAGA